MKRTELRKMDGPPPRGAIVVTVRAESGRLVNVVLTRQQDQRYLATGRFE